MTRGPGYQRGVALLDVLVALLVLALGVTAMSQLQGRVLLEGGHARARAAAAQLGREKLDDLRQFPQLPAGGAGVYGFDEIGSDSGGQESSDGSLAMPPGELLLSDIRYQRHWQVSAYSWCEGSVVAPGVCSGARRAGFQQVRVSLSWTDADGTVSDLVIETAFAAVDPVLAGSALIRRPSLLPPVVIPN